MTQPTVKHPDLKNSELHHDLKDQPGDAEDPDHADGDTQASDKIEKAVTESDDDTQIADALKRAVSDDG
ncbi:hypothetical protein KUL25_08820 [Rhodobacteraceae bacterium N5(2021)]|uniref:Uncharacterized protein n=1 Tax=Gymnodinialimonas phycosphaerae TaxID=2841589 RepID=A0A975YHI6_9RHOB|nr:hypothetical protein [Gymnodinialimonas phycosphaerae]MBY4892864.1 hypothetical protein [Gymnodinialimonas phycosphaerae]